MGFNGAAIFVRGESHQLPTILAAIEAYYVQHGAQVDSRETRTAKQEADHHVLEVTVGSPVQVLISDPRRFSRIDTSECNCPIELAEHLADSLQSLVVHVSLYEICDPAVPEVVKVFGSEEPPSLFGGILYGVECSDHMHLTLRFPDPVRTQWTFDDDDDDIKF